MAYQKTVRRNKDLQKAVNDYKKKSDMPLEHAIAIINGMRMKKGK